jgi:Zn-dependent protease
MFDAGYFAATIIAIVPAIALHEFGHAAMATKLGDPTPRMQGRLTLNPLAHLDPMGTLFIVVTALSGFGFGWGKPVQTNPTYYKNMRQGMILTAVAGPAMNLCLASVTVGVLGIMYNMGVRLTGFLHTLLLTFLLLNLVLIVFNLLPIPPLDGGHVVEQLLPWRQQRKFRQLASYGILILLGLMFFGVINLIFAVFMHGVAHVLALAMGPGFVRYIFGGGL